MVSRRIVSKKFAVHVAEWKDMIEVEQLLTTECTEEIWELSHRNNVLAEAEKYATVLPNLEWIYCGQWPMKIKCPGDGSFGNAFPLSEERDSCRTLLSHMFGLGEDYD